MRCGSSFVGALLLGSFVSASSRQVGDWPCQLVVWWSARLTDNAVIRSDEPSPGPSYSFVGSDGACQAVPGSGPGPAGTQELVRYYNSALTDTLVTSAPEGHAFALANNYTRIETVAWVLSPGQSGPAFEQWYSAERADHFLVGTADNRNNAIGAGYVQLPWTEGVLTTPWVRWNDSTPADSPFPRSTLFSAFDYAMGDQGGYGGADTWFPSWSASGDLYSPFTDGTVDGITSRSWAKAAATTGFARVSGSDPRNLTLSNVGIFGESALPYEGRYPCANLHLNGTWFYGTYALLNFEPGVTPPPDCGNWCVQGPFIGFRWSTDDGATWTAPLRNMTGPTDTLFGEQAFNNTKVRYGAPHVVDFGQNNAAAPGGQVYLVGHGADQASDYESWMQGSEVFVARGIPTTDAINDGSQWEFAAGGDTWTRDLQQAQPVLRWGNRTGVSTMTWVPAIERFVLCVSTPTYSPSTVKQFDTYFLESPSMQGPWSLITYLAEFGPQAYFVNIPSKFMSATVDPSDGSLEFWLSYSANFAIGGVPPNPPGSGYHWTLQRARFARA